MGFFKHYWVLVKLVITVFATVILMIYMGTFRQMAGVAADPIIELGLVRNPSPLVHSILALILLVIATLLGIYKPFGETAYGRRTRDERYRGGSRATAIGGPPASNSRWTYWVWIVLIGFVALFIAAHLMSGGGHRH